VITPPRGSILLETFRVVGVCLRAHASWSWINPAKLWEDLTLVGFWDPAKASAQYIHFQFSLPGAVPSTLINMIVGFRLLSIQRDPTEHHLGR
jgi:hypothetical protein